MLDFEEKILCRKVAGVLELAAIEGYEPIAFTKLWLSSKTAYNLYIWDFKDIAQSKQYLLHSIEIEYQLTEEDKQNNVEQMSDAMYWAGYTLMYLSLLDKIEPKELLEMYDIGRILQCYDTLHILSVTVAIDKIKEDFVITKMK